MYAIPPKEKTFGKTESIIGNWFKEKKNREKMKFPMKVQGHPK